MIRFTTKGSFKTTLKFLNSGKALSSKQKQILEKYGRRGVAALRNATPKDEGITADSWSYEIEKNTLYFKNDNIVDGFVVAVGLQYGHGTKNGGYIQGTDYINPELKPIFDQIVKDFVEEVNRL